MKHRRLRCGRWCYLSSIALLCLLASGCRSSEQGLSVGWTDRDGVRHVLVFGFGIVNHVERQDVTVLDVKAVGLVVDRGVKLGLVQNHEVTIDPRRADDVVVAVRSTPFGLTVKNFNPRDPRPPLASPGPSPDPDIGKKEGSPDS